MLLKHTEGHRLGIGYAQGGILSKLLVLEVYIGIIGPLLSPDMIHIRVQLYTNIYKIFREKTYSYNNYYYTIFYDSTSCGGNTTAYGDATFRRGRGG